MINKHILSLHNLSYVINEHDLFNKLSISFLPSSIIHIKGKNGSGKTSLIRIIAGIQKQTLGDVIFGYINNTDSKIYTKLNKPYCTYIGHKNGLKNDLSVLENLVFWSKIYSSIETLNAAIYYFNIHDLIHKKCYELSEGIKQKVALTKLLCCQSNLWLLDEVDSNLDENNKKLLTDLCNIKAASGGIIMYSSHNFSIPNSIILDLDSF